MEPHKMRTGAAQIMLRLGIIAAADGIFLLLFPQLFYYCAPVTAAVIFLMIRERIPYEIKPEPLKANAVCGFFSTVPLFYSLISEFSADLTAFSSAGRLCFAGVLAAVSAVNVVIYSRQKPEPDRSCPFSRSVLIFLLDMTAFFIGIMAAIPAGLLVIIGASFFR